MQIISLQMMRSLLLAVCALAAHLPRISAHVHVSMSALGRRRPFCIGVAGATASGKTSVVAEIVRLLDAEGRVATITQDCFYKALTPEQREQANEQKSLYIVDVTGDR